MQDNDKTIRAVVASGKCHKKDLQSCSVFTEPWSAKKSYLKCKFKIQFNFPLLYVQYLYI
jgi:hypothetical protein